MLSDKGGKVCAVLAAIYLFGKGGELLNEGGLMFFDSLIKSDALSAVLFLIQIDKK